MTLRQTPCECDHLRRDHTPAGCSRCNCQERAPTVVRLKDGTEHESWGTFTNRAPEFGAGNTVAVRHGTRSDRLVSERAERLLAELSSQWPWLADADALTVDVLLKSKVRYDALDEYVAGVIEGTREAYPVKGRPRTGVEAVPDRVWLALARNERSVLEAAAKLGLNPVERAQLVKDARLGQYYAAQNVEEMVARGTKKLAALRARTPDENPGSRSAARTNP